MNIILQCEKGNENIQHFGGRSAGLEKKYSLDFIVNILAVRSPFFQN